MRADCRAPAARARPGHCYYLCRGRTDPLRAAQGQRCTARYIPARQLDELVWADLRALLTDPAQVACALAQARGGAWLPQELHARRATIQKAVGQLDRQAQRLLEAYLAGVIGLDELQRKRHELDRRRETLLTQQRQLDATAEQRLELSAVADGIEAFCKTVRAGLATTTFAQRRQLAELLIDRVIVTGSEVEIRYVLPSSPDGPHRPFCQLRKDHLGAPSLRLPLGYGALMLAVAVVLAAFSSGPLPWVAVPVPVVGVTALTTLGVKLNRRGRHERASVAPVEQKLADVTSVAEAVQRALLPPLPGRVGSLELEVVYLAAAAEARVGGDLYEVARTPFGIRLIVGDARGKGLEAVETAAEVLGVFREVAHEVYTLAEAARRIDASLARRLDAGQAHGSGPHEEFVTAVLAEIDPCAGSLTVYNCGHPPPLLLSPGRGDSRERHISRNGQAAPSVTSVDVPSPAPPLRLLPLGDCSAAGKTLRFPPGGALLFYTDGVTEARNPRHRCYPLPARLSELAQASTNGLRPDLLDRLRDDLLRHVGARLDDDAALVLVRAPAAWGDPALQPAQATAS